MKATVDPELCTGCEVCVDTCPEVFEMGKDEVAVAKVPEVPAEAEVTCRQAADDCPTEAISIQD